MTTIFYVTSPKDINFAINIIKIYKGKSNNNEVIVITHTELIKQKLIQQTNLISLILSDSDLIDIDKIDFSEIEEIAKKLELETNSNFWKYVFQDRWLSSTRKGVLYEKGTNFSRKDLMRIVVNKYFSLKTLFENYDIEKIIYLTQDCGTGTAMLLYDIAKANKLLVKCPIISKFGTLMFLNNSIYSYNENLISNFQQCYENYDSKIENEGQLLFKKYFLNSQKAYIVPSIEESYFHNIFNQLKNFTNYFLFSRKDPKEVAPIRKFFSKILIIKNKILSNITIKYDNLDKTQKFVFFPLHLEPELVLLLYAPYFEDQLFTIRNIAKSLPSDVSLLVKDHPLAFGRRSPSFYRELKKIPNVLIVNHKCSSSKIIKKSLAVATITGSAGIEAFYFRKPVVVFGNVFYNFLPSAYKCKNFEELPHLWNNIFKLVITNQEIYSYLVALNKISIDFNLLYYVDFLSKLSNEDVANYQDVSLKYYVDMLIK